MSVSVLNQTPHVNVTKNIYDQSKIAIIGLGYVGLPLAVAFGKVRDVVGFDINASRVNDLILGIDHTHECSADDIGDARYVQFTSQKKDLADCQIFIVTVPTPVDKSNRPDFSALISASSLLAEYLRKDSLVIYESTVYPGATEEICVPILEKTSGLKFNSEFYCGYSPERINPGDKTRKISDIVKITSGSTSHIAEEVDRLYGQIITAGTYKAESIKVAEAAKAIENTQRDINIALMNELSLICRRLNIDTVDVINAAATKWNFLKFKPGLVGGHCIGVDPYYLVHKAQEVNYHPEVILAGRRINNQIATYVADETIKLMLKKGISLTDAKILVLGLTFKENCPDTRNSKVFDVIKYLLEYNIKIDVYDPHVDIKNFEICSDFTCLADPPLSKAYDGIILAVSHDYFVQNGISLIHSCKKSNAVVFDVKHILPKEYSDLRL